MQEGLGKSILQARPPGTRLFRFPVAPAEGTAAGKAPYTSLALRLPAYAMAAAARRRAMTPSPMKPMSSIAQVEGSGTAPAAVENEPSVWVS
jgi:hypothetical protein